MNNNIIKYYIFQAFQWICFFIAIMVLFWQNNGLSMAEIMLLQSIYAISIVLFEVPTWYFADVISRKKSMIIWTVVWFLWLLVYAISSWFWIFAIAEVLLGLASCMMSGADEAWLYDELVVEWKEKDFKKIIWHGEFVSWIIRALASILWWIMAQRWFFGLENILGIDNFRMVIVVDTIIAFFIILIPFTFSEVQTTQKPEKWNYLIWIYKVIRENIWQKKNLLILIIIGWLFYGFYNSALRLYQPYFIAIDIPVFRFGIIFASFQVFTAFAGKYSYKIEQRLGVRKSIFLMIFLIWSSFLLMASGYWIGIFGLIFAYIGYFVRGFHSVTFSDYINRQTTSDIRATTLSVHSLSKRLIYAIIIPFIGMIVDWSDVFIALFVVWVATFVVCIPFAIWFVRIEKNS